MATAGIAILAQLGTSLFRFNRNFAGISPNPTIALTALGAPVTRTINIGGVPRTFSGTVAEVQQQIQEAQSELSIGAGQDRGFLWRCRRYREEHLAGDPSRRDSGGARRNGCRGCWSERGARGRRNSEGASCDRRRRRGRRGGCTYDGRGRIHDAPGRRGGSRSPRFPHEQAKARSTTAPGAQSPHERRERSSASQIAPKN